MTTRRLSGLAVGLMLAVSSTSCGLSSTTSEHFDPAAVSQLFLPTGAQAAKDESVPLVVLVPGGGWDAHDNTGLVPLAERLAGAGFAVVNSSYRAGQDDKRFPVPVNDVQCAIAYAATTVATHGIRVGPVIIVGHSAGGHLAALAAVSGDALHPSCADPMPPITGLVGLGGVYDTTLFEPYMTDFFGVSRADDPALWRSGDPIAYVTAGAAPTRLRVLLMAGERDVVVPMNQAMAFDDALRRAHVPVTLTVIPDAGHQDLYTPATAAAPIIAWVGSLAP